MRALGVQGAGDGPADAACGARDEGGLAGEVEHSHLPLIPAKARIQVCLCFLTAFARRIQKKAWVPAFAGMSGWRG
jgi:hypothetical protein